MNKLLGDKIYNAILGSNGLIGSYLKQVVDFTHEFNSNNINEIDKINFDTIYIAAPSGNRLTVNANPELDLQNISTIVDHLKNTKANTVVLIGTIDSILRNNLPYGSNRLWFEKQLGTIFKNLYILRLSSLIHKTIKKNVLYDFKNQCYIENINLNAQLQWYDLNNLKKDIDYAISNNMRIQNLVSEPISHKEIVNKFFPTLQLNATTVINSTVAPWVYSKKEIFDSIEKYLNE